jgi:hypothetical protein
MFQTNYLPKIFITTLFLALASCIPDKNTASYPNPTTTTSPLATPTVIGKGITDTPKPISTIAVNFMRGNIASIASKDVLNYSNEKIFTVLISQWLEKHKTGVIPSDPIKDYTVDKVIIDQVGVSKTTAWIEFSIQPSEYSTNWSTITMKFADSSDPWDHLAGLFTIYLEKGYIYLRWQPI